jgi:hypothetical protein
VLLPHGAAPLGRLARDRGLDPVELGNPAQALLGNWRGVLVEQGTELPPAMCPAVRQRQRRLDGPPAGQGLVGAVAIHLQHAAEPGQHRLGMLGTADPGRRTRGVEAGA